MKLEVVLNGAKGNSWHKLGLKHNPFPQIPKAELTSRILKLQSLGGEPIPNTDYIRKVLEGWSEEFVDLCCSKFKPGEIVRFTVTFPGR